MKVTDLQECLLAAAEDADNASLIATTASHLSRHANTSLKELLQSLSQKQLLRLSEALECQARAAAGRLQCVIDNTAKDKETSAEALQTIADITLAVLADKKTAVPDALLQTAVLLHDTALLAAAEWPELQESVAKLCATWWQADAPGREGLITQTIPYLLVRALSTCKAADVKRCYTMRKALALLDFASESIADVKRLLLRAAFLPAFLRISEGRKFLAFLFTLEAQMVRELGAIIRNQIPSGHGSLLDSYGEILLRAWRECTAASLLAVEDLIQGLMGAALHARTAHMAGALRRVLGGLHGAKSAPGVDALLLRLYRPILFRALAAANPAVRRNALCLLVDAFPLQDPDASNEDTDEVLTRQFTAFGDALGDECPAVRAEAVTGLAGLLDTFWELVPAAATAGFLQRIAGDLAFDGASVAVRSAALTGLARLAENPLAQPLMKIALPLLRPLMWDPALAVRKAMADVLLTIGAVRGLSVVEVVPLDGLLGALGSDGRPVAERLHRLLLPSYFPGPDEGPACVAALLRQQPEAGQRFCGMLTGSAASSSGVPTEHAVALACALRDHLAACSSAPAGAGEALRQHKKRKQRGPAAAEQAQASETPEAWESLLLGLAALCQGLALEPSLGALGSAGQAHYLSQDQLRALLDRSASAEARSAVLSIAAAQSGSPAAADIQSRCIAQLWAGNGHNVGQAELRSILQCLATAEDLESLLQHIAAALDPSPPDGGAASQRSVATNMTADVALRCLDAMLRDEELRWQLLSSSMMVQLLPILEGAARCACNALADAIRGHSQEKDSVPSQEAHHAAAGLSLYCRAALHLQLTTELVTAAAAAGAEEAATESMWQRIGSLAVRHAIAWGLGLLTALSGCGLERPSGLPGQPGEKQPRRKKDKGMTPVVEACSLPGLAHTALCAALCALAACTDAARLGALSGETCEAAGAGQLQDESSAELAAKLLRWTMQLPEDALSGADASMGDIRAQSLGHASRLLHSQLAAGMGGPANVPALDLAAALMGAGVELAEDAECLAMLRRHLPGLLKPLSMQTDDARWLKPLIKVLNAASKALPEEAEPAGRDQNSAAAANTRQDADVTKQAPKEQAVLLCAEHPFIKAVASAAAMAKVQRELGQCMLSAGVAWTAGTTCCQQ